MSINRNLVRQTTITAGIGAITLLPLAGWATFAAAFAVGDLAAYSLLDGENKETGIGTVLSDGMLARTTISATLVAGVYDITSPSPISLSGGVTQVIHGPLAELMLSPSAAGTSLIEAVDAEAQRALLGVNSAATLAALKATPVSVVRVHVLGRTAAGDGYEGWFHWRTGNFTAYVAADPRESNYVASNSVAASAGCWVRDLGSDPYDIRHFGALGNGVASVVADTAALSGAFTLLRYLQTQGKPIRLFCPKSSTFYAYNGAAEYGIDDLEWYGNGSHWRHVDPDQGTWFKGTIMYPGTYASNNTDGVEIETKYPINDVLSGNQIVFDTAGNSANFAVGNLVMVSSGATYDHGAGKVRYAVSEVNEVTAVSAGVLTLKYGVTDEYVTDSLGASPQVRRLNTGFVHSSGIPHRVSRRMKVYGMKFSVAETDEVNGGALVAVPNAAFQLGGTFESEFDVEIEGYRGWSGNLWCRSKVKAKIRAYYQAIDPGYGSHNSHFDIDWSYIPSVIGGAQASLLYGHEGSHDLTAKIKAHGPLWVGSNVMNMSDSGRRITYDVDIFLPDLNTNGAVIQCNDVDENNYVSDLTIKGKVDLGKAGKTAWWIRGNGKNYPAVVITNAVWSAGIITFTAAGHLLSPNLIVEVVNVVESVSPSAFNDIFTVVATPTADTFTVALAATPGTYTSGGTMTRMIRKRFDFSGLKLYGKDEGSQSAQMIKLDKQHDVNLHGLVVPVGGILLTDVRSSRLGMFAPFSNIDANGKMGRSTYHGGVFLSKSGDTPTPAFVANIFELTSDVHTIASRVYSRRSNFTATNAVAVEFQTAAAMAAEPGAVYEVRLKSNDILTRAVATVYVSTSGVVTIDTLASTAGAVTTSGTNLSYTNSSGADKTVFWTMLRVL